MARTHEAIDVVPRPGREDERNGWQNAQPEPTPAQDQVDQDASRAAVAVNEGMNRLELRVCDRSLRQRRKRVVVAKREQVVQQAGYGLGRRRHEVGRAGVVVAAPDPVLNGPDSGCMVLQAGSRQKAAVRFQHGVQSDGAARLDGIQSPGHGVDVAEHLGRSCITGIFAESPRRVGPEQPAASHFQSFDTAGGNRLGAEQQWREGFGSGECGCRHVQPHERGLGVRDPGCDIAVEDEPAIRQRIRKVDRIDAGPTVTPGQPDDVALPQSLFYNGHGSLYSRISRILEHEAAC